MTERQLAEAIVRLVCARTGHGAAVDGNYVSKLERGRITWPNSVYRRALRELFDAASDAELGFYSARTRRDAERLLSDGGAAPPAALACRRSGEPDAAIAMPLQKTSEPVRADGPGLGELDQTERGA
jgi:hypothetical protein